MRLNQQLVPELPAEALAALEQHLRRTSVFLEYGAGGSTAFAAALGVKTIVSVESSLEWVSMVEAAVSEPERGTTLHLLYADIGKTGEWGRPKDRTGLDRWHLYPLLGWRRLRELGLTPELVLVDGRFRVACFCASLIQARPGTTILFDDYANRKGYHVVESVCPRLRMYERMAEFCVPDQLDRGAVLDLLLSHIHQVD